MSDHSQILFEAPEIARLAPLFPAYQIEHLVAIGGMGAVYKAVQKSLDRPVAIKILPQEFSRDPHFCTGFEAEAKAMARLNHPNLIGVYDFGEVDGMLFIIMEFVSGQSLFHYAHGHRLASDDVTHIISGICQGLAHAHENGIVHRDIKPSNILLDQNKEPKIGDFGLARPVGKDYNQDGQIYGTPGYTAPEVVNAPLTVNHRADIFSIGVLIHELLTGRLPADDPRPASLIVGCDPRFDDIIRRATDPIPELRYPNAHQILSDLLRIQQPVVAAPAHLARPAPRLAPSVPVVKKSSGFSSLILAMLALAAVLGFLAYKHFTSDPVVVPVPAPAPSPVPSPPTPAPEPTPEPEPTPPQLVPSPEPNSKEPEPKRRPRREKRAPKSEEPPSPAPSSPSPAETQAVVEAPAKPAVPEPPSSSPSSSTDNVSPAAPPVTSFDSAGYLLTIQDNMKRYSERTTTTYREELAKNLSALERGLKRSLRDISNRKMRDVAEKDIEQFLAQAKDNGGRIPDSLDSELSGLEGAYEELEKILKKQSSLDDKMLKEIDKLRESYIDGLDQKRATLAEKRDEVAAEAIAKEIELARTEPSHFQKIIGCEIDESNDSDEWDQLENRTDQRDESDE